MKKTVRTLIPLFLLLFCFSCHITAQTKKGYDITISLKEKATKEPIIMATCVLNPLGAYAATDMDGKAVIKNIPEGNYQIEVTYVGFETLKTSLVVKKSLDLDLFMQETTLALKEVTVVARQNVSGTSTSSVIGRQAIDHLQASSLADVMQLMPGALMGNADMTSKQNIQIRQLSNNNTAAFGSGVVIDGVPMSNNGQMAQGDFSATAFAGSDLRQMSADDIDEVEVIRGIPSAEYGDLTSGLVVVHSKIGVTPWQVKGKVNPGLMNYSLGKGLRMNQLGVLNVNVDYAQAWGDPRQKTRSYDRYNFSVGYGVDITKKWHTDTKVRYSLGKDWSGKDPDAVQDGTESKNKNQSISLTHNGKLSLDLPLARTVAYTLGITFNNTDNRNTSFVGTSSGLIPIITAMETGYYNIPWESSSYRATGISESRMMNIYAKINNSFYLKYGKTTQRYKVGVDYKYDNNTGKGYYNEDERHPLRPNSGGRPRAFSDVPGLHQIAAFAEDNFTWNYFKKRNLRVQLGARFTAMQPFDDIRTFAFSPRLNVTLEVTNWLNLRGGIGMNSKTPGLTYLYPDKHYSDVVAANYMPQNDAAAQLLNYYTYVYNVEYSKNLKNATNTKIEVGADIKLPGNRKLTVIAYRDKTPNGFGALTDYVTYQVNRFTEAQGLIITPGQATTIDYNNPALSTTMWTTKGMVGNTDVSINKGLEFDFDLGKIKPINTSLYFSGAWQESKNYSKNLNSTNPVNNPTSYSQYGTAPFKVVYPSELDYSRYRRFVNTLRAVTNIPALRMVASLTGQVIWHNSNLSYIAPKSPIGWITTDLKYNTLTSNMLNGYIGVDGKYYETAPEGIQSVSVAAQEINPRDNVPTKNPVTWNISARLTKEFSKSAGMSFYANNVMFYEPFLSSSTSKTLSQRNTGTFSFGVELFFNL